MNNDSSYQPATQSIDHTVLDLDYFYRERLKKSLFDLKGEACVDSESRVFVQCWHHPIDRYKNHEA